MTAHIATRIVDSSRTNITGVGDNTNYTLPSGTDVIVLCSSVEDQGDRFLSSNNYHIQYSSDGVNYSDVPTTGTATVPKLLGSNTGTALTNDDGVASGERRAAPNSNPSDGFISNAGREHTTSNQLNYGDRVDDQQCEAQFALDFQYASNNSYRFRIIWGSRSGDTTINQTAAITVSATAIDYTRSASEAVGVADDLTLGHGRSLIDSVEKLFQINPLEAVAIKTVNYSRSGTSFPFSNFISDSTELTTQVQKVLSESIESNDSVTPDHDQVYARTPDDESVLVSDSVVVSISLVKTEGVTTGDSASLAIEFVADDSLTVSATPAIGEDNAYTRVPDDESVAVSDDATFALSIVQQDGVAVADTLVTDHDDDQPAVAEDTFTVSDSVSLVIGVALESSVEADDIPAIDEDNFVTRTRKEDVSVADNVLLAVSLGVSEGIIVGDSIATDHDDDQQDTASELATVSDSVSTVATFKVTPGDAFEVSDSVSSGLVITRSKDESLTISDSVDTAIAFAETPSDAVEVSEDIIADKDGADTRQPSDSFLVDDSVNLGLSLVTPDTGSVNDSAVANKGLPLVREVEDSILAGDGTGIGIGIDVGDQFEVEDRGDLTHSRNPKDQVSIDDFPLKTRQPKCGAITDDSNILDITFIKVSEVNVGDSAVANKQQDFEEQILDEAGVTDSVTLIQPIRREITATIIGNGGINFNLMKEAQAVATIDVWNVALNALGISTLATTEGNNPQQTLLNNTFPLFRKQFLSDHLWNGAKKTADLTKLDVNTTDQSVANRWKYVYVLPTDCMRVWRLNGQENKPVHVGGNSNIYTNRWEIEVVTKGTTGGDTNTGKYRALCTNENDARIEYVFDVGNDIDLLGPLTQHAMGLALAAFVATNFGKSASEIAQLEAQAKDAITAAKGVDGQEGTPQIFGDTSLLGVRSIGY